MKRTLDIVVSLTGLVLFAPLLAIFALLIKCSSRGPVFFRQERIGRGFKPFLIYKLRTMRNGAEADGLGVTFYGDKRITRVGKFLRKYKFDELPQLFNVLKGEMSLVGPRPELGKYVNMFKEDFRTLLAVKPGITDPASVQYLEEESIPLSAGSEDVYINRILPEKIRLSKDYIGESGVMRDIAVIFRTVFKSWGRLDWKAESNPPIGKNAEEDSTAFYGFIRNLIIRYRQFVFAAILLLEAALANYLAFVLRFEAVLQTFNLNQFLTYLPLLLAIRLFFHVYAGLYKNLWRYADIKDLMDIVWTSAAGEMIFAAALIYIFRDAGYARTIYILDFLLFVAISGGTRLLIRIFNEYMKIHPSFKKVLIVGAGDTGALVVSQMKNGKNQKHSYEPVGFIDDDRHMKGLSIHGVPILGPKDVLPEMIEKHRPEEILVSMPCDAQDLKSIYEMCKPHNVPVKKLPEFGEILNGDVSIAPKIGHVLVNSGLITDNQLLDAFSLQKAEGGRLGEKLIKMGMITEENLVAALQKQHSSSRMKPLSLEDLLQREPVRTDIASIRELIKGKTVFVTGAGGSIGSELCRQIMKYAPGSLILFDRYENSLFHIDRELRGTNGKHSNGNGKGPLATIVGDIQDMKYLDHLFSKYRPGIIFHAAAYKHVPLMEFNVVEAVKNNVFGTRNLLQAADRYNAESFVAISTDKAVNPTSVMGATKRLAEFLTIGMDRASSTRFSVVRFGNVLGTNGSVVPIFTDQLKKGGPLTVTHPEIKRFFMLVPEAMQLVLVAGSAGRGGEIFVLDMGEPVKILDLAENFIRLSGLVPHKEIKIEFSGLRPGEKLFEELFDAGEKVLPTFHEKLRMAVSAIPSISDMQGCLNELEEAVGELSAEDALAGLKKIVPNFQCLMPETPELMEIS